MRQYRKTFLLILFTSFKLFSQNYDPLKIEIITADLDNFWMAFDQSKPDYNKEIFQQLYLDKGTKGLKGFIQGRITSAAFLTKVVSKYESYYNSIRQSTDSIAGMKQIIRSDLVKFKTLYPQAIFPPVYFVIGVLNSGGTTSKDGLIIGAEMYGLTPYTPMEDLSNWLKTVIKPVNQIPHIVAHELVHYQQKYPVNNLLAACIQEGSADFIAELISGKHINLHVHEFANKQEKELWLEFKEKMFEKDFKGWLYSTAEGRPSDLGYWMGYKITQSFYEQFQDKQLAIKEILKIKNVKKFLAQSKYPEKFE